MRRTFPAVLVYIGVPIVIAAWLLAVRLIWEQTVWSWNSGPQMVGFSLMHSGLGALLILAQLGGLLWAAAMLIAAAVCRTFGGRLAVLLLVGYAVAWALAATPYGFWQRLFIERFTPSHAVDFLTFAAATGDLRTVRAFLDRGVDVNAQSRSGTALHGAVVQGELEVIEFLIARGADVNAINAYGDSPMANAQEARARQNETQALLAKYGGKLIRGSAEQRDLVIKEQVQRDIEEMNRRTGNK